VFAIAGSSGPSSSQIRDIGVGLAVGILMDTFLVRTVLVPATVALLGRWNWWPTRVEIDAAPPPGPPGPGAALGVAARTAPRPAGR